MSAKKPSKYMAAGEVAELFGVDPKQVSRWDTQGKLPCAFRTKAGHRRWDRQMVLAARAAVSNADNQ